MNELLILAVSALALASGESWPEYRGPSSDGHAAATAKIPLTWSESEHVKWKTPIPGKGWSSPVVMDGQVWLTTATEDGKELFAVCVDYNTGKILHDIKVFEVPEPNKKHDLNSYASPSPVVEHGRVYVHFGTYGTACLDSKTGKILWKNEDYHIDHGVGPGSSPLLFENMLFLHYDGMDDRFGVALDKNTGKEIWKVQRSNKIDKADDQKKAFCTPIILDVDGKPLLLSIVAEALFAYDPYTGKELWHVGYNGFSNVPRPVWNDDHIFIATGFAKGKLLAIRKDVVKDGKGDVTKSHVDWEFARQVPNRASPLLVDGLIYLISDSGVATCVEAKTGKQVWQKRLGSDYCSSPIYADGRIYFFDQDGKTTVLKPGREFETLAENQLDSGFMASPAVVGDSLIVRTEKDLYRIENAAGPGSPKADLSRTSAK